MPEIFGFSISCTKLIVSDGDGRGRLPTTTRTLAEAETPC